jgi:hypothetical protein
MDKERHQKCSFGSSPWMVLWFFLNANFGVDNWYDRDEHLSKNLLLKVGNKSVRPWFNFSNHPTVSTVKTSLGAYLSIKVISSSNMWEYSKSKTKPIKNGACSIAHLSRSISLKFQKLFFHVFVDKLRTQIG